MMIHLMKIFQSEDYLSDNEDCTENRNDQERLSFVAAKSLPESETHST